ncbi:unnamed protein product [Ceratitis capitata]|uniref:(Mediterranean fruit fly) hypothetical protein n=1 Tax=Ceratitis capitata TaxID=7213 RepID=A0A811UJC8_CERCA|nr:unnamed protein product [Ceratitis capitata]
MHFKPDKLIRRFDRHCKYHINTSAWSKENQNETSVRIKMKFLIVFAFALVASASAANLDAISQPAFASGRIINGYEAQKGEAPFIVSLKTSSHFCAGSIIDENWVLTAAHCLVYNSFQVVAGLHSRNDESDVQIRKVTSKSQYIVHEEYGGGVGPNDIGLIYIPDGFDLTALARDGSAPVDKVSLPSGKYESTGDGKLFGWGRDNSGALPNVLQTLDAQIIGYSECKAALPLLAPIKDVNICSYTAGTTDGACNGDSGGPSATNWVGMRSFEVSISIQRRAHGNEQLAGIVTGKHFLHCPRMPSMKNSQSNSSEGIVFFIARLLECTVGKHLKESPRLYVHMSIYATIAKHNFMVYRYEAESPSRTVRKKQPIVFTPF